MNIKVGAACRLLKISNDSSYVRFSLFFFFHSLNSLEYWYMSILVLMSGYAKDANIAISAFAIWYNIFCKNKIYAYTI